MMRMLVIALAVDGGLARWSDPNMVKDLARQGIERKHGLAERRQKGDERQASRKLSSEKKAPSSSLTDEQRRGLQSRVLSKRTTATTSVGGSTNNDKAFSRTKRTEGGATDKKTAAGGGGGDPSSASSVKRDKKTSADKKGGGGGLSSHSSWTHLVKQAALEGAKAGKASPGMGKGKTPELSPSSNSGGSPGKSPSNSGGGKMRPPSVPSWSKPSPPTTPTWSSPTNDWDAPPRSGKTAKGGGAWGGAWGKSRKPIVPSICDKRLYQAYDQIRALGTDGPFDTVRTPEDVTELCEFMPPEEDDDDYNFGCPLMYIPTLGFIRGQEEYMELLGDEAGEAFNSLVLYCACHQGFELGCAAKIPHGPPTSTISYETSDATVNGYSEFIPHSTPSARAEYCKMVGVWNGDFEADIVQDFTDDVKECGCFFVGTARDMVGTCPGVELGAYFEFPPPIDTDMPTPFADTDMPTTVFPTMVPTQAAAFEDGFEEGSTAFPDEPWSLSNGDIYARRRKLEEEEEAVDWAITTEEAYTGESSIKTPDLAIDGDATPRWANVTLAVDEEWGTPGFLTFYAKTDLGDDDYVDIWIDGDDLRGSLWQKADWVRYRIYVGPGSHDVTFAYAYNPFYYDDPDTGVAYVDEVTFTSSGTLIPTFSPTTDFPTYYLPTANPTGEPTEERPETVIPTYNPTGTPPTTPAPTLSA
mmetsp:Transcript_27146/g.65221  ORF Transcript_27146/g.65221 Transcript_27146/m.65221 type:complete len:697 (-) Transcript_27146:284-2374(-)